MDWKKKAGNALLGFVLITIGFAIGKEEIGRAHV
jgi:hypothetical protein